MADARKKIAVVLTHGIGEQIPMETLRGFVDAAWVANTDAQWRSPSDENPADIWFKPDVTAGSFELRRVTTRWTRSKTGAIAKGPRVDFFEFYWADLAEGTTMDEIWDWLRTLLQRWPSQVPQGLMSAWILLWVAVAVVTILSMLAISPWPGGWWHVGFAAAAAMVGYVTKNLISPYIGDVARYVRADPRNIAIRRAIRERGMLLLNDLHDSGRYERIIMVAHSLGSIIAYDLVTLLWTSRGKALELRENEPAFLKLRAVESAAHSLAAASAHDLKQRRCAYREAQRTFRLALRSGGEDGTERTRKPEEEWLISDLVTLGSPLAHAEFLLARDAADLNEKVSRWLYPTNWPQFQKIESEQRAKIDDRTEPPTALILGPAGGLFSYFLAPPMTWSLHHSAPFAAVRWTNIYDPHRLIFKGDIVSGPVAPVFGEGVRDIDLSQLRGQSAGFSHTLYWSLETADVAGQPKPHIKALQNAIDLLDRPDSEIW